MANKFCLFLILFLALERTIWAAPEARQDNTDKQQTNWAQLLQDLEIFARQHNTDKQESNQGMWQKTLHDLEIEGVSKVATLSAFSAPNKFYVILTTSHSQEVLSTPVPGAEVDRLTKVATSALQNPRLDPRPALQALYRVLFCDGKLEQALAQAEIQVALWYQEGPLKYVPPDALFDGQHYLVERPRLNIGVTGNSAPFLGHTSTPKTILALGSSQSHMAYVTAGETRQNLYFSPLRGVPEELRGIVHDAANGGCGPIPGTIMLDPAFTTQGMRGRLSESYSIVHMATHFVVGPDADTSFFLQGDGTPLTVFGLRELIPTSNIELLTLSACDTGSIPMADIAQAEGVQSVLVTLWSVNDDATSRLMRDFYTRWQAAPQLGKGEALRRSERALLGVSEEPLQQTPTPTDPTPAQDERGQPKLLTRNPKAALPFVVDPQHRYAHPYYWAPFTLIGNWR